MQVVILVAGAGERLKPLTETMSKVMIPVANKPLLEWTVDSLEEIADEIILVVRKEQKDIIEKFKDCKLVYQDKPLGTAHAIAQCEPLVSDEFIVMNGDIFVPREEIERFSKERAYSAACVPVDNPEKFGVFLIENNLITDVIEKPDNAISNMANAGMYIFDRGIFDAIRKTGLSERGEYEITDAIRILLRGNDVKPFELKSWNTISYPWDLLDLNKTILNRTGTQIGKNVEIRPGVYMEEPVAIGDNSVIGPNCSLRKYSSVGKNCKIGNAVEIKNSLVMDNSFVSHLSYVGDSIIGRNCNVGAGTIFANLRLDEKPIWMRIKNEKVNSSRRKLGSVVGDNVKFGVNVTVMPGKRIWPNLLIPPCITIKDDVKEQPSL